MRIFETSGQDINNWPTWHGDLEYCRLEGKFAVGSYFFLKQKGIRAVKITLTEVNKGYSFTGCTAFWEPKCTIPILWKKRPLG